MKKIIPMEQLRHIFRAMFVALVVAACFAAFAEAQMPAEVAAKMHREMLYPAVRVEAARGLGSGTVIYSDKYKGEVHSYILTNHHVVRSSITVKNEWDPKEQKELKKESRVPVKVEWFDYNYLSRAIGTSSKTADIVAYSEAYDLALLRIVDKERVVNHVARLAPEDVKLHLFETVWAVGSGLGQPPFPTRGAISNLDQLIDGHRYLFTSAPIIFGNSGGTLYHESEEGYAMIGVPARIRGSWATGPVEHMGFSIPTDTVYKFLRENRYHFIWGEEVPPEETESD